MLFQLKKARSTRIMSPFGMFEVVPSSAMLFGWPLNICTPVESPHDLYMLRRASKDMLSEMSPWKRSRRRLVYMMPLSALYADLYTPLTPSRYCCNCCCTAGGKEPICAFRSANVRLLVKYWYLPKFPANAGFSMVLTKTFGSAGKSDGSSGMPMPPRDEGADSHNVLTIRFCNCMPS